MLPTYLQGVGGLCCGFAPRCPCGGFGGAVGFFSSLACSCAINVFILLLLCRKASKPGLPSRASGGLCGTLLAWLVDLSTGLGGCGSLAGRGAVSSDRNCNFPGGATGGFEGAGRTGGGGTTAFAGLLIAVAEGLALVVDEGGGAITGTAAFGN